MRYFFVMFMVFTAIMTQAQPVLHTGDMFPDILLRPLVNAPVKAMEVRGSDRREQLLILNFWGTWCSPCLPEMDSLAKLQDRNQGTVRIVGVSNEPAGRLEKYIQRKPSGLWLASDTTENLYRQLALNFVGQAAILNREGRILALVKTDSINQKMIDRLLRGEKVVSSAETGNKGADVDADVIVIDSSMGYQLTWGSYRAGTPSMSKRYFKTAFDGRRISYFNVCPDNIYRDIYKVSYRQVVYEGAKKEYCQWSDKSSLVCVDLLVRPGQKDSLMIILRQVMEKLSPVKARLERRVIPVYVMSRQAGAAEWKPSASKESSSSFSGRGFEGTAIGMEVFSDYVANELEMPVIDETGLRGKYDIHTVNTLRGNEDMLTALRALGLTVVKTEREMDVVVIYKNS